MPFEKVNLEKVIESKRNKESDFKKVWDDSKEEYRLIGEMIALRKAEKIT